MTLEKTESAGYLANHMARLFAMTLAKRVQHLGLAPAQFMVLMDLWSQDGLTQAELVERIGVEQATMANTLARMKRDGLVQMRPSPSDRRAKLVFVTDAAKALEAPAKEAALAANAKALAGFSNEERQSLMSTMQKVIANLR